jgi:hypothetical protein
MPDQPHPNFPVVGFVAGTPLLTPEGLKGLEDLKLGDLIQTQPENDHQCDDQEKGLERPGWWESN